MLEMKQCVIKIPTFLGKSDESFSVTKMKGTALRLLGKLRS